MNHTTSNGDNYADAGVADCTIQWDYRLASGTDTDYVAFFFRMASGASRWAVYMFGGTGTYINKDGGYIGGSRSASPGGTAVHTVRLVLAGASLTFFLDGVQQFQYTMDGTNQTATKFGMLISGSQANGNYMDNLIITA